MLKRFFDWFGDQADTPESGARVELAAAVLMIEVIMADHDIDPKEEAMLEKRIGESLDLPVAEVHALIEEARQEQDETLDLYQYTRVINDEFDVVDKYNLLLDLWLMAWANGEVDKHEDAMIRKISDLLYLAHGDFTRAKSEAREALLGGEG